MFAPLRSSVLRSNALRLPRRSFASSVPPLTPPPPARRPRLLRTTLKTAKYSCYFLLSSAFGVVAIGAGIFLHDAFTYTDRHVDRVPINPLALHPEKGGPNNLPVVRVLIDDEDNEENRKISEKPRLIIVGGGWGVCRLFSH